MNLVLIAGIVVTIVVMALLAKISDLSDELEYAKQELYYYQRLEREWMDDFTK